MNYERRSDKILPPHLWIQRVFRSAAIAGVVAGIALAIGIVGYHVLGDLSWVDALLEASMILGGMGPVAVMNGDGVKIFASLYALFSGLVLISTMGILLAPWLHRMMHKFHAEEKPSRKSK